MGIEEPNNRLDRIDSTRLLLSSLCNDFGLNILSNERLTRIYKFVEVQGNLTSGEFAIHRTKILEFIKQYINHENILKWLENPTSLPYFKTLSGAIPKIGKFASEEATLKGVQLQLIRYFHEYSTYLLFYTCETIKRYPNSGNLLALDDSSTIDTDMKGFLELVDMVAGPIPSLESIKYKLSGIFMLAEYDLKYLDRIATYIYEYVTNSIIDIN